MRVSASQDLSSGWKSHLLRGPGVPTAPECSAGPPGMSASTQKRPASSSRSSIPSPACPASRARPHSLVSRGAARGRCSANRAQTPPAHRRRTGGGGARLLLREVSPLHLPPRRLAPRGGGGAPRPALGRPASASRVSGLLAAHCPGAAPRFRGSEGHHCCEASRSSKSSRSDTCPPRPPQPRARLSPAPRAATPGARKRGDGPGHCPRARSVNCLRGQSTASGVSQLPQGGRGAGPW